MNYRKIFKKISFVLLVFFAIIGIIFSGVFVAIKFGWTNVRGTISERNQYFPNVLQEDQTANLNPNGYAWESSPEWAVMKAAFTRDKDTINKAAKDAQISPRLLLGGVIGEQFRFFSNSRESFKSYFEPLKILASLSSFSYGIAGLKPETVASIDANLKDPASIAYLGPEMENIISYPSDASDTDKDTLRFNRITDTVDTYYCYLYVGLFMREVSAQWQRKGYNIMNLPGVLSTLYNLGFNRSIPKPNPEIGGAVITLNGKDYSFGQLGEEFYYSNELTDIFK